MVHNSRNTLLWKLKAPDSGEASYLFGTMHVRDERAFGSMELIKEKIDACTAFATEFNLTEADINLRSDALDLKEYKSLEKLLSPRKYAKIKAVTARYFNLDISPFVSVKPIVIANLISAAILSDDKDLSLDYYLREYADSQEKISLGIETYREQLDLMAKIPLEYQMKNLFEIVHNPVKYRRHHQKMADYYQKGDIDKLYQATKKGLGKMRRLLLYNRNKIMAERLSQMMREQSLFAAVGAAHLSGAKGLLRLLKQEDFLVKPVYLN